MVASRNTKAPKTGAATKQKVATKKVATPINKKSAPKKVVTGPTAPLFNPKSANLFGYWKGKWYDVEVVTYKKFSKGQHQYLIRWVNDPNTAKRGQWATNESIYPEDWIFTRADIPDKKAAKIESKRAIASTSTTFAPPPPPPPPVGSAGGYAVFRATEQDREVHKYNYKWEYFDDHKPGCPGVQWHPYNVCGSDTVEEAYQSWVTDPYIDVRTVHSGRWNYMVDFNQMQQTNVDHPAHTVRVIRRVRVDDGSEAMDEHRALQSKVAIDRAAEAANDSA